MEQHMQSAQIKNIHPKAVQLDFFGMFEAKQEEAVIIPFTKKVMAETVQNLGKEKIRNANNFKLGNELDNLGSINNKFKLNVKAIETLRNVETEMRDATAAEKSDMAKYTGWGGIPQVFDTTSTCTMQAERDLLKDLLRDEEYNSARSSVNNAHYTDPAIIKFMWSALQEMGFDGGKIIEPAGGTGLFFGCMPESIAKQSNLFSHEIDSVSSRIMRALYPDVAVSSLGFEKSKFAKNSFDLAISNVPFGNYKLADPLFDRMKLSIHDYFFAKSIDLVRPGGLVAFITSHYTMDKGGTKVRDYLAAQADLVASIRLPNGAFKKMANTDVMTDIIFLRKRAANESSNGIKWSSGYSKLPPFYTLNYSTVSVNEYYATHGDNIVGKLYTDHSSYHGQETACKFDGDLQQALNDLLPTFPSNLYKPKANCKDIDDVPEGITIPAPGHVKAGGYAVIEKMLMVNESGVMIPMENQLNTTAVSRIKGMLEIRDTLRMVLRADLAGEDSTALRTELNGVYDAFVKKHGFIWSRANRLAFKNDPDFPLLLSIEIYDDENEVAKKAEIFKKATIAKWELATSADNLTEGLALSLNRFAKLDVPYLTSLLGIKADEIEDQFLEDDIAYRDPESYSWIMKDEYLSGNVRQKLATAEAEASRDSSYKRNVAALQAVMPHDLLPEEIQARLGAPWIPTDDIRDFANELFGIPDALKIGYAPTIGAWEVNANWSLERAVVNTQTLGTPRRSGHLLLEDALNQRTPSIHDMYMEDGRQKQKINEIETEAARDKWHQIRDKFKEWVWVDDTRAERLAKLYNERYNSTVERKFDGSHLMLPGINQAITLRASQKNAIWRILVSKFNTLLAHAVGAGKTMTMIGAGFEAKRLGICNKPTFVVPNHMLEQFSSEFLRLYPAANILAAGKEDLEGSKRRTLLSRIATGNWDGVIITHSSFGKLALSNKRIQTFMDEELRKLSLAIMEANATEGGSNTKLVKQLESAKKRLVAKLEVMLNRHDKDDVLSFEELGIDFLSCDEADLFKNLWFPTKMTRVAGLPQVASLRAFDMFLKTRSVMESRDDRRGVVFATATPISNSIAEMYTMQKYLQPDTLEECDLSHFDNWAANFAETVTAVEVAPDGSGYRMHTRFCRFVNVPELMMLFRQVADIQTKEMLKLPTPTLDGGRHTVISVPSSQPMKDYVASLVERSERVKSRAVSPSEDNMLCITNDGRKAALDIRLVDPLADEEEESKAQAAANNIYMEWEQSQETRLTQLVFCDLSTPTKDGSFNIYGVIRDKLTNMGVPNNEIAFVHDYDSDAQKAKLFKRVREGIIRILLGSTSKCGFGTNIQDRLVAEHQLDAPWRPRDVEQRDGRIERQGNMNEIIRIYRYVKEGSFDAYSWQTLETKLKFISQVMSGDAIGRTVEDVEVAALSYAEVKAIASGNPMILEKAGVDSEVAKLSILKQAHQRRQQEMNYTLRRNAEDQILTAKRIDKLKADLNLRDAGARLNIKFSVKIEDKVFGDPVKAGMAIVEIIKKLKKTKGEKELEVGSYKGFKIVLEKDLVRATPSLYMDGQARYECSSYSKAEDIFAVLEDRLSGIEEAILLAKKQVCPFNQATKRS
jgi:N12 class adenine-specific DNA methylase